MKNIEKRTSVRTYDKGGVPEDILVRLEKFIGEIEETSNYRFPIINATIDGKVGTYGVITGANYYICAIVKEDEYDLVRLGYLFEKIIIFATSLNLGTCWLGGTFNREEFSEKSNLKADEKFIAATPIGFEAEKKTIRDRAMRKIAKSDNRKKFGELFLDSNLNPLSKDELGAYKKALEMVRIGPSASNKQPWRIVKVEDTFHLYLKRTTDYAKMLEYDIQLLDMGIAKYHFEITLKELGEDGNWEALAEHPVYKNLKYISSWVKSV